MGRPNKFNLDYFPLDVDFFDDHKLLMIEDECGIHGGYMAIRIMSMVYSDKGYYMEWPDNFEFTIAKRVGNGYTGSSVLEIFKACIKNELFNKSLFEKFKVVTSSGIQKRWMKVQNDLRRKIDVNVPFWIIDSTKSGVSSEETNKITKESTQKEIKGKEIKEENILGTSPASDGINFSDDFEKKSSESDIITIPELPTDETESRKPARKKFVAPNFDQVKAYLMATVGNPANGNGYWPEDLVHNESNKLMDHYIANGWKQGKGKAIIDWQATCRTWIRNFKEGAFSNVPRVAQQQAANQSPALQQSKPVLSRNQNDLNYFFDRYREDPTAVTEISIDPEHYNTLKDAGMITFSESEVQEIREKAIEYLKSFALELNDKSLLRYMKKVGVLHFFKQLIREDRETIFKL